MTITEKLQRQLNLGVTFLRFGDSLEYQFIAEFDERLARGRGAICLVALVIVALSSFYESFLFPVPEEYLAWAMPLQWAMQVPVLLLATFVCWSQRWRTWSSNMVIAASLVMVFGQCIERYTGVINGFDVPYSFAPTIVAATFFLGRPRFRSYLLPSILSTAAIIWLEVYLLQDQHASFYRSTSIVVLIIIGAIGGYIAEHSARTAWLHGKLLEQSSVSDFLTGLYNRRGAEARLKESLAAAVSDRSAIGLMVLDIDFFKNYNDSYGHAEGDACLQMVAKELSSAARRPLDVVARMGGEEFLIAWHDIDPQIVESVADTIRADIAAKKLTHEASPVAQYVTVSGGLVCVYPTALTKMQELINKADRCLYKAKQGGRNKIVFDMSLGEELAKPTGFAQQPPLRRL